jgi:hypothetical protein
MLLYNLKYKSYQEMDERHPDKEWQPADEKCAHDETQADRRFGLLGPRPPAPLRPGWGNKNKNKKFDFRKKSAQDEAQADRRLRLLGPRPPAPLRPGWGNKNKNLKFDF